MSGATEAFDAPEALMQFLYGAPIGLVQVDAGGNIQIINPMTVQLLMPITRTGTLENLFDALDPYLPGLRDRIVMHRDASGVICEALRFRVPGPPGGEERVLSLGLMKLDPSRLMAMLGDATLEARREEEALATRLHQAARVDGLTQMPNRQAVLDQLEAVLDRSGADEGREFAVLFLNCDRFKQINDGFGHHTGDEVLGLMAERLRKILRSRSRTVRTGDRPDSTMIARIGGDEFAVVLEDLRRASDVQGIADRILDALSKPYCVAGHRLHCGVSIGIVMRAQSYGNADAVLQDGSIAMAEAKRAGGCRAVTFESHMQERAARFGDVEASLRRALQADELFVVYQPVVGLTGGSIDAAAGVEALVRWRHPVRGVVPPVEFIGIAEEVGLIGAIGDFVLATACRQFMEWRRLLGADAPRLVAVNLSRAQLAASGFVASVGRVLAAMRMPPACLQLEVTESLAAQDPEVQARLHELKALGLTLALDDFGTGYSSLSSLHELPVDVVKIDRSFVAKAHSSRHHRVLIEATIRVANSLGMGTVAEGIETDEQAAVVRELGCDKGQGYLYSRPLAAEAVGPWLTQRANCLEPQA